MRPLACVPALYQANIDDLRQVVTQAERNSLDQATKDIFDEADINTIEQAIRPVPQIANILFQGIINQAIKNILQYAMRNCTKNNWHKVSSCRFVFAKFMDFNELTNIYSQRNLVLH